MKFRRALGETQHDNPTLGQELMINGLADVFRIDQRRLSYAP